jgi:RHS repeat-associated protein
VARRSGGSTHYFLRDSLHSVRGLLDSAGNLTNRYEYDGFGQVVQSNEAVSNPYRYAGRRWEAAAGLYDSRARFYDASTGRFIQPDPLGILESPNLYQYALNNPVNRIDPLGWSSEECNSINYELQVDLGSGIVGKIKGLLTRLPGAPEIEVATKIGVEGKSCEKCCEKFSYKVGNKECEGCKKRAKEDSLTIKLFVEAEVKYPFPGTIKIKIATGQVKIGIEAYAKLTVGGEGSGTIDLCAGTGKISVCASGELVGGIRGGLIEWPFEKIKLQAYVYGEVSGSCKLCVQYDKNGITLGDTGCQACAGYGVEIKIGIGEIEEWEYRHEDKWCI